MLPVPGWTGSLVKYKLLCFKSHMAAVYVCCLFAPHSLTCWSNGRWNACCVPLLPPLDSCVWEPARARESPARACAVASDRRFAHAHTVARVTPVTAQMRGGRGGRGDVIRAAGLKDCQWQLILGVLLGSFSDFQARFLLDKVRCPVALGTFILHHVAAIITCLCPILII